jgi:hypothetical protein
MLNSEINLLLLLLLWVLLLLLLLLPATKDSPVPQRMARTRLAGHGLGQLLRPMLSTGM